MLMMRRGTRFRDQIQAAGLFLAASFAKGEEDLSAQECVFNLEGNERSLQMTFFPRSDETGRELCGMKTNDFRGGLVIIKGITGDNNGNSGSGYNYRYIKRRQHKNSDMDFNSTSVSKMHNIGRGDFRLSLCFPSLARGNIRPSVPEITAQSTPYCTHSSRRAPPSSSETGLCLS